MLERDVSEALVYRLHQPSMAEPATLDELLDGFERTPHGIKTSKGKMQTNVNIMTKQIQSNHFNIITEAGLPWEV